MIKNRITRPDILKTYTWKIIIITYSLFVFNLSLNICLAQTVTQINRDSLSVITPGENGVPYPKTVKAGNPTISANRLAQISIGEPEVIEIDHGKLNVFTPGQDSIPLPKTYIIPDSGFTVQNGDTIYAPVTLTARYSLPIPASPPRYKDAATYNIQYMSVDQGMPSSYVFAIYEDTRGNIWFGTWGNGVSCYNGKTFTNFTTAEGLVSNRVLSIMEDAAGNIWFGAWGGISCYDGKTFTIYTQKQGLANNYVWEIIEDANKNIWIATDGGVSKLELSNTNVSDKMSLPAGQANFTTFTKREGLANNYIRSIIEDTDGNIWFGTYGGGLSRYDGKSFTNFSLKDGLPSNKIMALAEDKNGIIWIGTIEGGLSCYNGKSFKNFTQEEGNINNYIWSIIEDKNGNILIGTEGGGVSKLVRSKKDGSNEMLFTKITETEGLANNSVWAIFEDTGGNIWIGTGGGGVSCFKDNSFTTFTEAEGFTHFRARSILEDKHGNMWFGTEGGGMSSFDGKSFTNYKDNTGLLNNRVMSMIEDGNGNIWCGIWDGGGGLSRFDGISFTNYTAREGLANNEVYTIFEDKIGSLWFAARDNGITRYDGKSFTSFTKKDGLANNNIRSILEDKDGNLWFGTYGDGVSKYDGTSFTTYTETEGLPSNIVNAIIEDSRGNIWFGTDGGLSRFIFDAAENQGGNFFRNFTINDGLPHNMVLSFAEDSEKNLWIGTEGGITVISLLEEKWGNSKPSFFTYTQADGLKGLDVVLNSVCINTENQIWWGMGKGLAMLNLNEFELPASPPVIQFNDLEIAESFVDFRLLADSLQMDNFAEVSKFGKTEFTGVPDFYNYPFNIELPYFLNHLTFRFSAIDWAAPHKLEFQYKLEGLDKDWSQLTKETKAEYRNLPNGTFTFKVKAIGGARKWSETFEYEFTIHPPWWRSWWANVIYSFLVVASVLLIVKLNSRRLVQQKQQLEQIVKERTYEISQQKEEIQSQAQALKSTNIKLIELDEFKQNMTGMIVHDLKNPLNGIINVPKSYSLEKQNDRMKLIGKHILNMVLNILDVHKYEETKMVVEKNNYSLLEISQDAIDEVTFLAEQKHISILNEITQDVGIKSDKDLVDRIFVNILTNAIKYTPNNGNISLSAAKNPDDDSQVYIEITDSGQGIPQDQLFNVFDKFGQVSAKKSGKVRSTGLGLTFCKMAVEAHGGEIGVKSEVENLSAGIGGRTTFWFTLPIGKISNINEKSSDELKSVQDLKNSVTSLLTTNDLQILEPFLIQFKTHKIYEVSILRKILKQIEVEGNENIECWKEEMSKAIRSGNELIYNELINNILL